MQYMGGKHRIAKELSEVIESYRKGPEQTYLEPFVGACNVIQYIKSPKTGTDIHESLVELWKALQQGWVPPDHISEQEYREAKNHPNLAYKGFVGFGCSFGGRYFEGYARDRRMEKSGRDYAQVAKKGLLKKIERLKDTTFFCCDYRDLSPKGQLIYCDPPYQGTKPYQNKFNTQEFWSTVQGWSKHNTVLVSEYTCPLGLAPVWSKNTHTNIRGKAGIINTTENLYLLNP